MENLLLIKSSSVLFFFNRFQSTNIVSIAIGSFFELSWREFAEYVDKIESDRINGYVRIGSRYFERFWKYMLRRDFRDRSTNETILLLTNAETNTSVIHVGFLSSTDREGECARYVATEDIIVYFVNFETALRMQELSSSSRN